MNIIRGLRSFFQGDNVNRGEGLPYANWQMVGGMWVQMTDDGRNYINKAYNANNYIRAIVEDIASKASTANVEIYKIKSKTKARKYYSTVKSGFSSEKFIKSMVLKAQAFDQLEDHPFLDLINQKPNTFQTGKQLKKELHGYKLVTGNSYMYASVKGENYSDGKHPQRLWSIPSPAVNIVAGDLVNPVRGYEVNYYSEDLIPTYQIAHFKEMNLVSDITGNQWLYGRSRLSSARDTIGGFKNANMAQNTLFQNMGPVGIVSGNGGEQSGLTEESGIAIQDKFEQKHTGLHNGGKLVVTPADVKFTALGISPVDLNLIEAKGELLQELCALYNYPKENFEGSQNVASQGTADKKVITSCVIPLLSDFDDVLTAYVREAYNDDSLVVISDIQHFEELQENRKQLAEWLNQAWWIKVNEKRRVMDYDEVDGGDVMLVPMGLSKLEDVIADSPDIDIDLLEQNNAL